MLTILKILQRLAVIFFMKQKYYLWGASLLALFALILSHNIIGALNNCIHAVDFSIYQQAIYEIAAGTSLNPYLTV